MTEHHEPPENRRKTWLFAFAGAAVIAAVLGAEAMQRPEPKPFAREFRGEEGDWRTRVGDKGYIVPDVTSELLPPGRYNSSLLAVSVEEQHHGATVIRVTGTFDPNAAGRFERYLTELGDKRPNWVVFDAASGGYYRVAEAIGRRIREEGLNTMVPERNACDGVCMAAFIGGRERTITSQPYIGGGQFTYENVDELTGEQAVKATQASMQRHFSYYRDMGVDPTVVEAMITLNNGNHYRFSAAELKRANVATKVE